MIWRDSLGRRYLVNAVGRTTAREIARRLRVHASTVSRWLSGETRPSEAHQTQLLRTYGIPKNWR